MKEIVIANKNGITLKTKQTLVDDDIKIKIDKNLLGVKPSGKIEITTTEEIDVSSYETAQVVDKNLEPQNIAKDVTILGVTGTLESGGSSEEEYPSEAIKYYKENRNKNYPYFPLPYEMEETQDTIYMLYGASGYMCCPAFNITFTKCVCTVQKYMNTTLVSEYVESVTSNATKYLQFSEEDSDYSTYNYIVIKLQGSITKHYLNYVPKFNGVEYNPNTYSGLLEVSGKCVSCDIKVNNTINFNHNGFLEYYSFVGISTTNMKSAFYNIATLQTIPQLDTSSCTDMQKMFQNCSTLKIIPQLDMSSCTNMSYMFGGCKSLQTIPQLDTSSCTNMQNMFYECSTLQTIPQLDMSSCTDMSYMFNYCSTLKIIPQLDMSSCTNMSYMFGGCKSLQTISQLDMSKVTKLSNVFSSCYSLHKLDITNMKVSFSLSSSTMLSQSELVNIFNNLATVETTQTLTLGSTLLAKLTDEDKAIATNKGWTLA